MSVLNYIWARLNETSTWIGIGVAASAITVALQNHATLPVAVAAGVMAVLLPENKI